jgi:hypothetical protein
MTELQEQFILRSMEYDSKYEESKKRAAELAAKQELEEKHVAKELLRVGGQQEQLEAVVNSYKEYVKDILNFSSVINHIVIQDEIDRQGTALYALKTQKLETPQPTFQLDPNCVNCENKTTSIINQAFKMACLTYNPSQIKIDEQLFSREEILEISTSIL